MPHQSLDQISGNSNYRDDIERRFELTSNWCSHIVGRAAGGQATKAISQDLNIASSTIQNTIDQAASCFNNESLHQSDHSNIVSDSLHHHLLHEVHANPKICYRDLWLNLGLHEKTIFKFSLYHELKKKSITNWLVKKRSVLTSEIAAKHFQFVKDHEHWDSHKWKILWNDKCSVE